MEPDGLAVGSGHPGLDRAVGVLTFIVLYPRDWHAGTNVSWLAQWSGASSSELKDAALEGLVDGFHNNTAIARTRGGYLTSLLWAVVVQTLCVVLVQLSAAADAS